MAPEARRPAVEDADARAEAHGEPLPVPEGKWRVLAWLPGLLLLAGLVGFVLVHRAEEQRLAHTLREVRPWWILVAAALQVGTYFCAGGVLARCPFTHGLTARPGCPGATRGREARH